ncbi:MAG TPA: diguanylate cyclase, partial [Phycisphaerales bacterium]|nr:diguanylate cyclase [Phycisphaerales bacterium]
YITKPFEMAELRARVRSAMRIRSLITLLAQRAQIDGLTGLWNRAYLDHRLGQSIADARRTSLPLSLIMCDLDHFKKLNDAYGHPLGDQVLEEFARILANNRVGDISCRYGGEEFAVICPNVGAEDARNVADRVRRTIRETAWDGCPNLSVTCSFGVTDLSRLADASAREMIESADRALYEAKHSGRDTVCVAPALDPLRLTA